MELKLMSLLSLFISGALGHDREECEYRTSDCDRKAGFRHLSVTDMFNMFTGDLNEFNRLCFNNVDALMPLEHCVIAFCRIFYRLSKYAYLYHMCMSISYIREGAHCWDSNFPRKARDCYEMHFPSWRTGYYPWAMRVYDRDTIARQCFADEARQDCRDRKSDIMYRLMPAFNEFHYG